MRRLRRAAVVTRAGLVALAAASVGALEGNAPAALPVFSAASSAGTATAATVLTVPRPAGVGAGHVLVATIAVRVESASAITAPSGWTDVVRTTCGPKTPLTMASFVKVASGGEPAAYTFTLAPSTGAAGSMLAYTGVDAAQPVAGAAGQTSRNTRGIIAPSVTATAGGTLVGAFAHSGRSAISAPAGMASRVDVTTGAAAPSARLLVADQILSGTGQSGSRDAETTQTNYCNIGQLVALRAAPDPPANTALPAITGIAQEGFLLVAGTGSWTGAPTGFAYQWQSSADGGAVWTDVPGATAQGYVPGPADVGLRLRVSVRATNAGGSAVAGSQPTPPVLPAPPTSTSPPVVTGDAREGTTLTATAGAWTGAPTGYGYRWERSGDGGASWAEISGPPTRTCC